MAFAIGTCTDWIDALRDLRDFADGTLDPSVDGDYTAGGQVPMAQRWTVETNGGGQPGIPSSGTATDGEVYLTGPGGGSDEIHVQFRTYRDTSIFGWEIRGATGFSDAVNFQSQLQVSPPNYYILDSGALNVWMYVNGRRLMAVFQSGSVFECMYAGFINQYPTANMWPYPLMVGGSVRDNSTGIAQSDYHHSCMPQPAYQACHVRFADGVWYEVGGLAVSGSSTRSMRTDNCIWPYAVPGYANPDGGEGGGVTHSPIESFNPSTMWASFNQSSSLRVGSGFTGAKSIWPCTLLMSGPQDIVAGELEGLFAIFGESDLGAGDDLSIGGDTYDVFKTTWQTEFSSFFAIKRE